VRCTYAVPRVDADVTCTVLNAFAGISHDPMQSVDDSQDGSLAYHIVVLDLDYDGCCDVLGPEGMAGLLEKYPEVREKLTEYQDHAYKALQSAIAKAERAVVMLGSNRQDYGTEAVNTMINNNGYATRNIHHIQAKLADQLGSDVELFKALRADGDRAPGAEWELITRGEYTQCAQDIFENLRNPERPDGWEALYTVAPRTDLKQDLLEWQIDKLQEHFGSDKTIHIYFYDDRADIIEALADVEPKPNVKITRVHMCYWNYVVKEACELQDTIKVQM